MKEYNYYGIKQYLYTNNGKYFIFIKVPENAINFKLSQASLIYDYLGDKNCWELIHFDDYECSNPRKPNEMSYKNFEEITPSNEFYTSREMGYSLLNSLGFIPNTTIIIDAKL